MRSLLSRGFVAATGAFTLAATAAAQGSNDCATATVISGTGTFNVTTVGATDSAQQGTGCVVAHTDVWFKWTAPSTNTFTLATCGGVSADSVVDVYNASACPTAGQVIACNDDSCGLQSSTNFSATSGTVYMLQLGAFGAGTTYTGTFSLNVFVPPPPCGVNTGPDITVGDLSDVLNVLPESGIDAVALGTVSCNMGNVIIAWVSSTPAHPVIRQNVYKYKVVSGSGRFEQIGLSWLKHAFAVAPGNTCCTCTGSGGGMWPGCSDPYGSGLNGSQSGLGPNWQVNAHTGVFTYPPANPAWSGNVARRCEMLSTDVENTGGGVRYFGEGHYVTADDAAAGNQNNNASYRELTCTSGSFTFTGTTTREQPAIRAWAVAESGVTLNNVQIANDGLLVTGAKATSLGGGQWHYEYGVYNMNADRNVGSFSVPIPAGVTVSNIGFHDVFYHDGDGNGSATFSGTDWAGSVAGGAITWACETQAVNNNANAIRWGSTYNFRFDANAAPVGGVMTMGLWKPGTPTSVTSTGDVPGHSAFSAFCLGDGTGTACPCGNNGTAGHGCANSSFAAGALLSASGTASVAADTAALSASSMTGSTCVFFQGDAQQAPVVVDDGLGCVTGSVIRLGTKTVAANASSFPQAGDLLISVRGAVPGAGGTRYYQCFYRNAVAAFCPPATSNRTNGMVITWAP
ncbi:MAG: hypothetical protein HZA53_00905 [Planctomycetes bacterium]|nr:hypothetical protein [Planctomycetota bacterium]